jgi:hypothetical protein
VVGVFAFALAASAQEYEIKMTRAQKVGDKYDVTAKSVSSTKAKITVDGKVEEKSQDVAIDLAGEVTVVQVDAKTKDQSRIKMKVKSANLVQGTAAAEPFLKAGDEVEVWHEGKEKVVTVNGNTADEELSSYLEPILSVHQDGDPSDDDVYGSKEKKKVGDTWPINKELLAKEIAASGMPLLADGIAGLTKLVSVGKKDGVDCMKVEADITVKLNIPPPVPGLKVSKGEVNVKQSGNFPIDTTKDPLDMALTRTMVMTAAGNVGPAGQQKNVQMDSTTTQKVNVDIKKK